MATMPPSVVDQSDAYGSETTRRGTAYEHATELVSQAADYCYGERAVRTIRARVDAWAPDTPESPPLGDLQRVWVYGTLHLRKPS